MHFSGSCSNRSLPRRSQLAAAGANAIVAGSAGFEGGTMATCKPNISETRNARTGARESSLTLLVRHRRHFPDPPDFGLKFAPDSIDAIGGSDGWGQFLIGGICHGYRISTAS